MRLAKSFISFLLILSYSLGLAHNIVPHEHSDDANSHAEHQHVQHHSADHHHSGSEIVHNGHHDHNFIDFMKCLLTDLEHFDANLEFICLEDDLKLVTQSDEKLIDLIVPEDVNLFALFGYVNSEAFSRIQAQDPAVQLNLSRRGPPLLI